MILEKINSPKDVKKLSYRQLKILAEEIREFIIEVTSNNGGHLASNLGVVELTLALHKVFNAPQDKIIFDIGHQIYTHKIITGRKDKFKTLRKFGGISGFANPDESVYDIFKTGHGCTSISSALGLAVARDLKKEKFEVVAVIGDGGLSGGMAFEALNNAGALKSKLIVILNDNGMFISQRVGALSLYLSKIRTSKIYETARRDFQIFLDSIPLVGSQVFQSAKKVKDTVKYFLLPGIIFEQLGFHYLGPVDGNNLQILEKTLAIAKEYKQAVLVHVVTTKGKGYPPAEEDAISFHGISPQKKISSIKEVVTPTYTEFFGDCLNKIAKEDPKVVAITAAMREGCGLVKFAKNFPERFFDVGMAEQHAVTFSAGLAKEGFKPVCAIYSTFLQRAFDQVIHDVCLQNLPVIFAIDRAGIVGEDGATHQGIYDLSYLRLIPNLVIASPKDENEFQNLLYTAVNSKSPFAIRYPRARGEGIQIEERFSSLEIGKAEILKDGEDLTIFAAGNLNYLALDIANDLEKENIFCAVINLRFVKPLDKELILNYAQKTRQIVTLEENTFVGGLGSAVAELLSEDKIAHKIIALPDAFIEHGEPKKLKEKYGLTKENILKEILSFYRDNNLLDASKTRFC